MRSRLTDDTHRDSAIVYIDESPPGTSGGPRGRITTSITVYHPTGGGFKAYKTPGGTKPGRARERHRQGDISTSQTKV